MVEKNNIKQILNKYRTIAVVGLSRDPNKDSYMVSSYLKTNGYTIIPVNPFADQVLGEKSYPSLFHIPLEIQKRIEIVDIFRPAKVVPIIIEEVIKLKRKHGRPHVIWMQLNIIHAEAAQKARNSGLQVVINKCMMIEHLKISK